jgi:hypothetical protein
LGTLWLPCLHFYDCLESQWEYTYGG